MALATRGEYLCFRDNAEAFRVDKIPVEEYFENMLVHLSETTHDRDRQRVSVPEDPICRAVQELLYSPGFIPFPDIQPLLAVLTSFWYGNTTQAELLTPTVLAPLETTPTIHAALLKIILCITIQHKNLPLTDYTLSLTSDPSLLLASQNGSPVDTAAYMTRDAVLWDLLLTHGWRPFSLLSCTRNASGPRSSGSLSRLAFACCDIRDPLPHRKGLMAVIIKHGGYITNTVFNYAIGSADIETVTYFIGLCNPAEMNESGALLRSVSVSTEMLKLLLDAGMDINWQAERREPEYTVENAMEGVFSPTSMTALSCAALQGIGDAVRLLLERGANRELTDSWGRTPERGAREEGFTDIADLILGWAQDKLQPFDQRV